MFENRRKYWFSRLMEFWLFINKKVDLVNGKRFFHFAWRKSNFSRKTSKWKNLREILCNYDIFNWIWLYLLLLLYMKTCRRISVNWLVSLLIILPWRHSCPSLVSSNATVIRFTVYSLYISITAKLALYRQYMRSRMSFDTSRKFDLDLWSYQELHFKILYLG